MPEREDKKELAPTVHSSPGSEATLLSGETHFRRLARGAMVGRCPAGVVGTAPRGSVSRSIKGLRGLLRVTDPRARQIRTLPDGVCV